MNTWITYRQNHESHTVVNRESVVLIVRTANVAAPALENLKEVLTRQHFLHIR